MKVVHLVRSTFIDVVQLVRSTFHAISGRELHFCLLPYLQEKGCKHDHFTPTRKMRQDVRALTARNMLPPESSTWCGLIFTP